MDDGTLNQRLRDLDEYFEINRIPYMGALWREVDFERIPLGRIPIGKYGGNIDGSIGIMAANKWCYDQYECTKEESQIIRALLVNIVNNPCERTVNYLINHLRGFCDRKWLSYDDYEENERQEARRSSAFYSKKT